MSIHISYYSNKLGLIKTLVLELLIALTADNASAWKTKEQNNELMVARASMLVGKEYFEENNLHQKVVYL